MYKIKTYNAISDKGLSRFPADSYDVGPDLESADAYVLRSHKLHGQEIPDGLAAIARAGAGTNNVPVEDYSAKGVVVFNTPGANANAVKELVLTGILMSCRDIAGGIDFVRNLEGITEDAELAKLLEKEKKRFFKNQGSELPKFKYCPIRINPFELKQKLSKLRVQDISDVSIRNMYESVINSYFDKIDLLSSLNTPKFLYNSLRYFGRPSKKDIQNANYLLHLPEVSGEPKRSPSLGVDEAMISFKEGLVMYGFESKIEKSNRVIAQVMVLNAKKTILFNPTAKFTRGQINALVEHEIGVHMVTTMNSNAQKLHLFNLGLPVNTMTQEGLAILAEYLSGNISMKRLKKLAFRVIVVDMMCHGADFIECYNFLVNDHSLDQDDAFSVVTRIFRGGGFTKDYLYLSGFVKILRMWENDQDLEPLLVGKTSLEFHSVINEMIHREMVQKPIYVTNSFKKNELNKNEEIYKYILSGMK